MIKLQKSVQITLIIVIAFVILTAISLNFFKGNEQDTIKINGQATEKVIPDLITVYFNVETKGGDSRKAEDENSLIVANLRSSIINLGFSKDDLKTESFNIYPEYDYNNGQRFIGYKAVHSLKIEFPIEKQDKIGSIIDAGTNAGAGINYINFELSPSLEQQSKAKAIKTASNDAKIKAEALALGFDKKLGRLVSVSLDDFNYYPWKIYESSASGGITDAKEAVTSITPSEREVSASVTAVYKLR